MIVDTNVYLKMPANTYSDSRFLVVLEPLLSPPKPTPASTAPIMSSSPRPPTTKPST